MYLEQPNAKTKNTLESHTAIIRGAPDTSVVCLIVITVKMLI